MDGTGRRTSGPLPQPAEASITLNPAIFVAGGTAGNVQGRRRFPEYGGVNHFIQDRESQYHALQLTLNRRYANGFTVNTNYTLSDLQGTIEGTEIAPYFHPDLENIVDTLMRGRMPDMRRHRFVTSWVYDIPGVSNAVLNHVVGGWQVTGIYQWQSGKPYTIVSGADNSGWGLGGNNNRAIRTGQPLEAAGRIRRNRSGSTRRRSRSIRSARSVRRDGARCSVPRSRQSIWGCSNGSASRMM